MSSKVNFTVHALDNLESPEAGKRTVFHDAGGPQSVPGLQLRVAASGIKSFSVLKRIAGGRPERVTLGRYPEISIDQARKKAKAIIAQLAQGQSPSAEKRASKVQSMTLRAALVEYVAGKRRGDGLALKERTQLDYLAMLKPGRIKANGTQTAGGCLHRLADRPLHQITAAEIKALHAANLKRGERSAAYSAQVLRAVLAWHGVVIPHSPFSRDIPGRDRIRIPPARATGRTIPPERIGPWWRALNALPESPATEYLKLCLLTGCRPSEPLGVTVADCDLVGGRMLLKNTKNRKDHTLVLSAQAQEIVERQAKAKGKGPADRLFPIANAKRTVRELVKASGVEFSAKTLRATFASIAEGLVSAYCLKKMLNHSDSADITGTHYVRKGETELRAAWQAVATYIEAAAADNVVPIRGAAS